ncbi:hypothetical protein [Pseudanabaena mucicola]|uniref:WxL domain-containing protein n=1 Tax=Pseudanabaena mucicola FACHB-723 TaxID=2692860 RepID=A0ABR8A0S2_9CYAN|nr:hypothetical protein [Pseudanabaena mucicola]MBD2189223.1 hypothetical protein [Pseudanabaena mucicola FACHB-723]
MLFTTLRQLVSISGRTILAIGLTSVTVFALAPSAKAEEIVVNNGIAQSVTFVPVRLNVDAQEAMAAAEPVGTLNVVSNSAAGYIISAASTNNGSLKTTSTAGDVLVPYTLTLAKIGTKVGNPATPAATDFGLTTAAQSVWSSAENEVKANNDPDPDITVSIKANFADIDGAGAGTESAPAGLYRDTITFTIEGK